MVREREPPKYASPKKSHSSPDQSPPLQDRTNQLPNAQSPTVEFGKTTSLSAALKEGKNATVFNIPKQGKRPEHHRSPLSIPRVPQANFTASAQPQSSSLSLKSIEESLWRLDDAPTSSTNDSIGLTHAQHQPVFGFGSTQINSRDDTLGQPPRAVDYGAFRDLSNTHSTDFASRQRKSTTFSAPRETSFDHKPSICPMFSATSGFKNPNSFKTSQDVVDLTSKDNDDDTDEFDVSRAVEDDDYNEFNPYTYMGAETANNNIKALLDGAFEDESDKPKTRLHKKKKEAASLTTATEKLKALDIGNESPEKISPDSEDQGQEDDGSVEGLNIKLLPHQIEGFAWMVDKEIGQRKRNGVLPHGGILADDMGLGKTIQALALIVSNPRPLPNEPHPNLKRKIPRTVGRGTLIVAPLALLKQWESEIESKVSKSQKIKVLVHHGPSRSKGYEELKKYDIVITTYHTLSSEFEHSSKTEDGPKAGCFGVHWYRVILDEAHSIKNRNAKMTKASYSLRAIYRWCLTGTPMQNNLDELQSLIRFLQIKPYNDLRSWKDQITGPMRNGRGGLALKRLQYFLKAFMKRRTKDILKAEGALEFGKPHDTNCEENERNKMKIVERKVETIVSHFSESERQLYDRLAARTEKSLRVAVASEDYIGALVLILRLRQMCNHPDLMLRSVKKNHDDLSMTNIGAPISKARPDFEDSKNNDIDNMASMFGALSVESKSCELCRAPLDNSISSSEVTMCVQCEQDLATHRRKSQSSRPKSSMKPEYTTSKQSRNTFRRRRIVEDDDDNDDEDDDGEGEWLVSKNEQSRPNLGKAGGADDENAEGGGQWLGVSDSDTDDEIKEDNNEDSFIEHDTDPEDNESEAENEVYEEFAEEPGFGQGYASTKIRRLIEVLKKESHQHKFIVFSEFTSMLDIVEPLLERRGFKFCRYDGSMRNDEREASLQKLREDRRTRILLCSLKCGSLGLNLTAASRVVILEPFWNPFVEEQAIDRVHRLNQTKDVMVYRLTIANSVEERILELQEKKRELANAAIEGGNSIAKLNMKDIMQLFGHQSGNDSLHETNSNATDGFSGNAVSFVGSITNASSAEEQRWSGNTESGRTGKPRVKPSSTSNWKPEYGIVFGRRE